MFHPQTSEDQHPVERSLHSLCEGIKQRDFASKRQYIITTLLEDAPKSFTKLFGKDTISKDFASEQRIRSTNKYVPGHTHQVRSKYTQKNFFKALEEEHRLISRENMQLLGLTIQKINYLPKSQKGRRTETVQGLIATVQPEMLNFQNTENIPQGELFVQRKNGTTSRPRGSYTRPQSIRVRGKQSPSVSQRRRRSVKPYNPQYQNPIYEARIVSYRQLLFKLQWSYGFYSQMESLQDLRSDKKYKVWIGGGNNSMLIRQLMKRRFWWQIMQDKNNWQINFLWTQLKVQDYFNKQKVAVICKFNQLSKAEEFWQPSFVKEQSRELYVRTKNKKQKQKQNEELKDQQFLNKIMSEFEQNLYRNSLKYIRNKPLYERQKSLNLKEFNSQNQRMHNHLTHNFHLGNKKALFYNLKEYYELTSGNLFQTIPLTFHIKTGFKDPQYKRFVAYYKKRQAYMKKQELQIQNGSLKHRPMRNIWIVKPGELTNRGNGITVIDEVYELDAIIKAQKMHDNGSEKTFIVQLYIDRPFLYKKRKFDIRHYMMISQINGVFKAYWFKEGYIRTASYQFDIHNLEREIHLTNDAIQKYTPHYGKYEPANKVSYVQFQKYLDSNHPKEKYSFEEQILPRMKEIAIDAVKSTFVKISPERYKHNFEIFGLDFMIDGEFHPWLIEVNTNPCLELVCPLLTRIIPQMLDQALRLTLDVIYPPPCEYPNTAKHLVPEASLESLRWQLVFDERINGKQLREIYRACKGNMLQIGDVSDNEVYQQTTNNQPITLQYVL